MRDGGDVQEAITQFADAWRRYLDADRGAAHATTRLAALGYAGDTPEKLERWVAETHPAGEHAAADALCAVIAAIERRPEDDPALRTALADLAPYLGLAGDDAPTVLLHTLTARLEAQPR